MTFNSLQVQDAMWQEANPNPLPPTPRPPKRSLANVRKILRDQTFLRSIDKEEGEEDDIRGTIAGTEVTTDPMPPAPRRKSSVPPGQAKGSPADDLFVAKPRPLPRDVSEEDVLNGAFRPVYKGSTSSHPLPNRHRGRKHVNATWAKMSDEVKHHLDSESDTRPAFLVDMNGYVQSAAAQERQMQASKQLIRKINLDKVNEIKFNKHLQSIAMFSSRNRVPLRPTSTTNDHGERVTLVLPRNVVHPCAERLIDKHYPDYRVLLTRGPHALLSPKPTPPPGPKSAPHAKRRVMSADVKRRIQELAAKYVE